jgi:hypothetical protein
MKIQVNTDSHVEGHQALSSEVEAMIATSLRHFANHVTRVEIHLSDENSAKGGSDDKRCMIEARLKGRDPIGVTHQAGTTIHAVEGAAEKMKASLESTIGRLSTHRRRGTGRVEDVEDE